MAGRRARSLVYDDTRDAGQALPAIDQFTEYTAIAASFAPLASAAVTAPPPPPLPGTPSAISASAGEGSLGTPEFESIIKNFTDRLLSAITEALGGVRGSTGPESEVGIPGHLRKESGGAAEPTVAEGASEVEPLPELPGAEEGRAPIDRVHDRESRKRAERRARLGLPPEEHLPPPVEDEFADEPPTPLPKSPSPVDEVPDFDIPIPSVDISDPFAAVETASRPERPALEAPKAEAPPLPFGGAAVEDIDTSFQLVVSSIPEPKGPLPSPLPQPEMAAEIDTSPASPEFQPLPPKQEPPTEPSPIEQQQEPSFTHDEINDVFIRHGASPEMPEFVRSQDRPRRNGTPDDPNGYKRYADEQHDQNLSHMGVLDSMMQAQDDIGRQHNEYNNLMLDYMERLGKDNNNDARRLRALNAKLQRDRTSLTDVNI